MNPTKPLVEYVDWIRQQVVVPDPAEQVRKWSIEWRGLFRAMANQAGRNAICDVTSLAMARWEFLGALLRGSVGRTNVKEALAFSKEFLEPINANYAAVERLVDHHEREERFDVYAMLRNKPLHGLVPAAIASEDGSVVAWWMGFDKIVPENHLTVSARGLLHVDVTKLCDELEQAMNAFADHLDQNVALLEQDLRLPRARWRRGYWARFCPKFMNEAVWMDQGFDVGVPR